MISQRLRILPALLLLLVFALATTASAQLARVGPVDPANGFPTWYQDKTGLALDLCLPANQTETPWCLLPVIPNGPPEVFPTNWAIENFYSSTTSGVRKATIPGTTGTTTVLLIVDLEASFANGFNVIPGDQVVFGRTRIKISPVPFSGDYTVYTPVGKFVIPNAVAGDRIFFTEDIGLAAAGNFTVALGSRIGPFLLPSTAPGGAELPPIPLLQAGQDPFYDALVAAGGATLYPGNGRKYITDPARLGPITGGKTGTAAALYTVNDGTTRDPNIFRIEGPNGFVFETTTFTMMGRVFEGAIAGDMSVDRASYARSATANSVDVYATATPSTQARIPGSPAPASTAPTLAYYDAPCTPTLDAAGNPGPPYSAPAGVLANQMFNTGSKFFGNSAPNPIPSALCVQSNSVNSLGQTVTVYIPQALSDQVFITEALFDPSTQSMSVKATSSDQVVAQTLNVEGYGAINATTGQLVVNPLQAAPESVSVLSSGGGLNRMQMSAGAVAGGTTLAPTAANDSITMFEDCQPLAAGQLAQGTGGCTAPQIINVLANDTNAAGGTVTITSAPGLGAATVNADQTISYTPRLNANGTDTLSYTVTVGTQVSNSASVTITITPVNDSPIANNDSAGALRGFSNTINVLTNDSDPDGNADLASAVIVTGNAALGITAGTVYPGGSITFTPPSTLATGTYQFSYNAVDQAGAASAFPATVSVAVSSTEAIVVAKDIYTQKSGRWTVQGTISPAAGQTMTITYDLSTVPTYKVNGVCTALTAANNPVIGTAAVDSLGNWLYDQILTTAQTSGLLNPSNTLGNSTGFWCTPPKNTKITSSLTGGSVTSAISLK